MVNCQLCSGKGYLRLNENKEQSTTVQYPINNLKWLTASRVVEEIKIHIEEMLIHSGAI